MHNSRVVYTLIRINKKTSSI